MNYTELISKAWKFLWKHKILWLFGILAPASAGSSSSWSRFNSGGSGSSTSTPGNFPRSFDQFWQMINQMSVRYTGLGAGTWLAILAGLILIAILVSLFLGTLGTTGLIKGASMADQKKDEQPLSWSDVMQGIKEPYWRIFRIQLLLTLITLSTIALLGLVFYFAFQTNPSILIGLGLIFLPLLCIIVPLQFVFDILLRNTYIVVVDEGLRTGPALRKAWQVIRANLGQFIIVQILIGIVNFVFGLILVFPTLLALGPMIVGLITSSGQFQMGSFVATLLLFSLVALLGLLLKGLLNPFLTNIATLAYRRLRDRGLLQETVVYPPTYGGTAQ